MMFKWIASFQRADREMKWFILTWVIYGIAIIATTVYCYARLDYVRSYEAAPGKVEIKNNHT